MSLHWSTAVHSYHEPGREVVNDLINLSLHHDLGYYLLRNVAGAL